jgi:Ni,Fe-hydrogenase III component G
MAITFDFKARRRGAVDTRALVLFADWMRSLKRHRKHVMRCHRSTLEIDIEIRVLRDVIQQLHILREPKAGHFDWKRR